MLTLYGIDNCDTCRKARIWMTNNKIKFKYHDLRKDGIHLEKINKWIEQVGYENLLNRRSTTWRNLPENVKKNIDILSVADLILTSPTILKRPIIEKYSSITVGFSEKIRSTLSQ